MMAFCHIPNLNHAHRLIGVVQFLMLNPVTGEHTLNLTRTNITLATSAILVRNCTFKYPCIYLQAPMGMPSKPAIGSYFGHVRREHPAQTLQGTPAAHCKM